jgi:hypothetical protein
MRKLKPRHPDRLRSDVLWSIVDDVTVDPRIRSQMCEIARHLDGERLRIGLFVLRA